MLTVSCGRRAIANIDDMTMMTIANESETESTNVRFINWPTFPESIQQRPGPRQKTSVDCCCTFIYRVDTITGTSPTP